MARKFLLVSREETRSDAELVATYRVEEICRGIPSRMQGEVLPSDLPTVIIEPELPPSPDWKALFAAAPTVAAQVQVLARLLGLKG